MSDLVFQVQSLSSAGPDRVVVNLTQINPSGDPSQPFYGSNLSLNLGQEAANAYEVNQRYSVTLTPA